MVHIYVAHPSPVFSDPNTSYGSTSFGEITGTKVGARNVQLGMKYYIPPLTLITAPVMYSRKVASSLSWLP